jgi:rubrerythrin
MALNKDMCGILAMGAQKERAARDFYLEAARKTRHPLGKQMFDRLAGEETKHQQLLEDWANVDVCPVDVHFPPVDKDFIKKGRAKVAEKVKADTGDLDAIELGQEMERKSIQFYLDCAGKAADAGAKDLFTKLKAEEDKHFLVNPGLWSVRDERANFDS